MKRIIFLCILTLFVAPACFAQNNQTESLTITTYFPAPYGVYKNIRLIPSQKPAVSGNPADWRGALYFNSSEQVPYVHNGTDWVPFGSGGSGGSGFKVIEDHGISPDQCNGTLSAVFPGQLCSGYWFQNITFKQPFKNTPDVLVVLEEIPDPINSSCADNQTDQYIGYPSNISQGGFRLWASGSPRSWSNPSLDSSCGWSNRGNFTRAIAGWYAAGE